MNNKIIPILISMLALILSWRSYNQTLPLQQANVVLSESDVEILPNEDVCQTQEDCKKGDMINISIKNIGKTAAKNIKFKIYNHFIGSESDIYKIFDNQVIHDLQPETKAKLGWLGIAYQRKEINLIPLIGKIQVILIFNLEYQDAITKKNKEGFYFFHYILGDRIVKTLIDADYEKLCQKLKGYLQKNKNDEKLLEFVKSKPCAQ